MAPIEIFGSLGLGFVWGWLVGGYSRSMLGRKLVSWLILLGATLLLAWQTHLFLDWRHSLYLLMAGVSAAAIHLAWLHNLSRRNQPGKSI
jgi:hypothetical protein